MQKFPTIYPTSPHLTSINYSLSLSFSLSPFLSFSLSLSLSVCVCMYLSLLLMKRTDWFLILCVWYVPVRDWDRVNRVTAAVCLQVAYGYRFLFCFVVVVRLYQCLASPGVVLRLCYVMLCCLALPLLFKEGRGA
ncbi:hypothetical protein F4809DRAFT_610144 [Biscogniauxia mediterranea]|nr:hypothetical protein F4809DRAFT_610144 [Biscogniauxia mediterranea]